MSVLGKGIASFITGFTNGAVMQRDMKRQEQLDQEARKYRDAASSRAERSLAMQEQAFKINQDELARQREHDQAIRSLFEGTAPDPQGRSVTSAIGTPAMAPQDVTGTGTPAQITKSFIPPSPETIGGDAMKALGYYTDNQPAVAASMRRKSDINTPQGTPGAVAPTASVRGFQQGQHSPETDTAISTMGRQSVAQSVTPPSAPKSVPRAQINRAATSVYDSWMNERGPQIVAGLLKMGEVEKARALDEWMKSSDARQGTKDWATAFVAAQMGDWETFGDNLVKAYNRNGYFPDGMSVQKDKSGIMRDGEGNITGFNLVFKDQAGREHTQQFTDPADVVQAGLFAVSPEKAFEFYLQNYQTQQAATAKGIGGGSRSSRPAPGSTGDIITRRRKIYDTMLVNDLTFASKSPEEQAALVDSVLRQEMNSLNTLMAPQGAQSQAVPVMRRP